VTAVLAAVLGIIQTLIPIASGSQGVTSILALLTNLIPVAIKEYNDLLPIIQNIIRALKDDPTTTPDQLVQLEALNQQVDQAFEAAATKAQAEDAGT
jgi:hypothetical protein